jgi:dTDP-4-amino-4,6-dideoxygalactose transaminase
MVEPALTSSTRAVVVTHLYGLLADIEAIVDVCRPRGIVVVEDCAQAVGARRATRAAGSFGDVAAFSFYPTKNLGALGDGGAVGTNDDETADRVRRLRQYGWDSKYSVATPGGWNSRLDEFQAAVLRYRLGYLDQWNARRREIVRRYTSALPSHVGRFVLHDGDDYVAHLAVVLAEDRQELRKHLDAAGVSTDVHYPIADHRQEAWRDDYPDVALPVTEHAVEHVLTVPCFPELSDDEVERVCEAFNGL